MSVTYPHDRVLPHETHSETLREEPYVPVYARTRSTRGRKGGVKTWMILAPLGVLVLGGAAAALVAGERNETAVAPLAEPAATGPVLPAQPVIGESAPIDATAAATIEAVPEPVRAAPVQPRRASAPAPVRRAAPAPAAAPRAAPAEPAETQPYTSSLNAAPAAAPASPAPASTPAAPPVIVIQPAG